MLNVTPASGPPLQIRSEEVSFFQNLCLISLFDSVSPCLSSALSIHPPDATWRSQSIKRDVQFPAPSPSEENKGSACCFSHCWPMSTSHRSLRCVCVCCQLCTCVSSHQSVCVWVHSNSDSWIPLNLKTLSGTRIVCSNCVDKSLVCVWRLMTGIRGGHHNCSSLSMLSISLPPWAASWVNSYSECVRFISPMGHCRVLGEQCLSVLKNNTTV